MKEKSASPQPRNGSPRRHMAIVDFKPADIVIDGTNVQLSSLGAKFIDLISGCLNSYTPPTFLAVPALEPWPNDQGFSGFIDNPSLARVAPEKYRVEIPIYSQTALLDPGGNGQIVDVQNLVAKGTIAPASLDPGAVFDSLTPLLTDAFTNLIDLYAKSERFGEYNWAAAVADTGLPSNKVKFSAGDIDNIQTGDLYAVYHPLGPQPTAYQAIAVIQVISVEEDSSTAAYYGDNNQAASAGDLIMMNGLGGSLAASANANTVRSPKDRK